MHKEQDDNFERTTDYALNVLYVFGEGPTEAGRLLGLLGLPTNDTTMESHSFGIVEEKIGPVLRGLCKEIIRENIIEESQTFNVGIKYSR
jgi:hypothetical protein